MLFFDVPIIDPIISILIALFIIFNIYKNLKSSLKIFLQGVPGNIDLSEIEQIVSTVENVEDVHDVHAWSIDGQYNIVTLHIVLPNNLPIDGIRNTKRRVKQQLQKLDVHHITIECESVDEECELENC
jgi:cobalt-zinc-cadmium efflux system protein